MDESTKQATEDARTDVYAAIVKARKAAEAANRGAGGREIAIAITKLEEAYMWLRAATE